MAGAPPRYPEVPVIPEGDSLALVLGGLTALGAVALYRRRRT
jgi:LPXTG-motif cell wall-anchored protein